MKLNTLISMTALMICWASVGARADEKKSLPTPPAVPGDTFFKKDKTGVNVEFDCSPGEAKSPYCLIRLKDTANGVICYGLVSTEKVVNPTISCVPTKH